MEKYRRRKHEQLHLARAQRCVLKLEQDAGRGARSGETSWKPSETREGGSREDWREDTETRNPERFQHSGPNSSKALTHAPSSAPPPSKAYLLILQVHDFLPNYLSSTPQSRSTMPLRSLAVTLGLGCSWHCLPCQDSASESQEENSSLKPPGSLRKGFLIRCYLQKGRA